MNRAVILDRNFHKSEHVRRGEDYARAVRYLEDLGVHRIDMIPLK